MLGFLDHHVTWSCDCYTTTADFYFTNCSCIHSFHPLLHHKFAIVVLPSCFTWKPAFGNILVCSVMRLAWTCSVLFLMFPSIKHIPIYVFGIPCVFISVIIFLANCNFKNQDHYSIFTINGCDNYFSFTITHWLNYPSQKLYFEVHFLKQSSYTVNDFWRHVEGLLFVLLLNQNCFGFCFRLLLTDDDMYCTVLGFFTNIFFARVRPHTPCHTMEWFDNKLVCQLLLHIHERHEPSNLCMILIIRPSSSPSFGDVCLFP